MAGLASVAIWMTLVNWAHTLMSLSLLTGEPVFEIAKSAVRHGEGILNVGRLRVNGQDLVEVFDCGCEVSLRKRRLPQPDHCRHRGFIQGQHPLVE